MDLLNGGDLRYHICRHRRFNEETTSKSIYTTIFTIYILFLKGFFVACLIAGLEYCHEKQIIHRDIKTSNILVFEKNLFKITDFGISKCMDSNRFAYTNIGTPYYMAPEIVCGQPYDFSVDYWALGCMIYKLLTKKYPFEARNIGALVLRIKRGMYNSSNSI